MNGYKWVPYRTGGHFPEYAIRGGEDVDGTPIFVGRANYRNDSVAAKVMPMKSAIYVSYGGNEISLHECEVLVQAGFNWVYSRDGNVPAHAVSSGHTSDGETLYVGRVHHNGACTVGKIHPSHGCCYIPFDSDEKRYEHYEVLVCHF